MATKSPKKADGQVEPPRKLPLGRGPIWYTTSNTFKMPVAKVWAAATEKKHLKKHFVDDMLGEFGPKLEPVAWYWKEWGWWTLTPIKYRKNRELAFLAADWEEKYNITVRFEILRKGGKTVFRVHEHGYPARHLRNAFMMCEGWTEFHCGVKAYLLSGIDLR